MTMLFTPLAGETRKILDRLIQVIDKTFPLPRRFRPGLPSDVAELSRLFTSRRDERNAAYLGRPNLLSAYLRCFLPWNLYRLCRLLPSLDLVLKDGDLVIDLGSGPLTLALALWTSRPELRNRELEFRCVDRTGTALDAGKKLFTAFTEGTSRWNIKTIRGEIRRNGTLSAPIRKKGAALVAAVNLFNEIFWELSPADTLGLVRLAEGSAALLESLSGEEGAILIVEPGIPRSGEFISSIRDALLGMNCPPLSPCVHAGPCPFPGAMGHNPSTQTGKAKWCHFSFSSDEAPESLQKLSAAAGIPKDRVVTSFLLAGKSGAAFRDSPRDADVPINRTTTRIISGPFPLGNSRGRYGCSAQGAVLVSGTPEQIDRLDSGNLAEIELSGEKDAKSKARIGHPARRNNRPVRYPG